MKYFICLLTAAIVSCSLLSDSYAQEKKSAIITGKISDKDTGNPLDAASIYFAETTIGSIAKKGGVFTLVVKKPGNYELVASMVGYYTEKMSIYVEEGKSYNFDFILSPKPMTLKVVEVEGIDIDQWRKNLELFKRRFLGPGTIADYCKIENPEYINFSNEGDNLIANTDRLIVIINNYLGYKISVELLKFKLNSEGDCSFNYIPQYSELLSANTEQSELWKKNRAEAYYGSPVHFMWALRHGKLAEEMFKVNKSFMMLGSNYHQRALPVADDKKNETEVKSWRDLDYISMLNDNPVVKFANSLEVIYNGSKISFIEMKYNAFSIDENGIADHHLPFVYAGAWAYIGLANLLPRDYFPPELKK